MVGLKDSIHQVFASFEAAGGAGIGVQLGPSAFVELTQGFDGGDLVVVAGRPGMGKSSLAMQWALDVAGKIDPAGVPMGAAVFSCEMPHEQLTIRAVCAAARVNANRLKANECDASDWSRLTDAAQALSRGRLSYYDRPGMTPLDVRSKSRRFASQLARQGARLGLVVIDYLQLIDGRDLVQSNANREQEVSKMSAYFKRLAQELRCPVALLSQLSRACESRTNKRPQLSDLRESGAIEQDADAVVFVYRDEAYQLDGVKPESKGVAELILAKRRGNRIGTAKVRFDAQHTHFSDLPAGHPALADRGDW
jgi:replicative DNA helicase